MSGSSAECAQAKKIASESCSGQVNVAPAESVKDNPPDVPSVPNKAWQEEPQKPRATLLRLPAEGEPCECECEREAPDSEMVVMAEGTRLRYRWNL